MGLLCQPRLSMQHLSPVSIGWDAATAMLLWWLLGVSSACARSCLQCDGQLQHLQANLPVGLMLLLEQVRRMVCAGVQPCVAACTITVCIHVDGWYGQQLAVQLRPYVCMYRPVHIWGVKPS